jgi:hypothetical protein
MSSSVREKMAQVIKEAKHSPAITPEVKNEATPPIAEKPASKPQAPVKKQAKKKTKAPKKV